MVDEYIPKECFDWCKEQVAVQINNYSIGNLNILGLALFFILIYKIYDYWHINIWVYIHDSDKDTKDFVKLIAYIGENGLIMAFICITLFKS